ncbi:MAG: redox-regulated ATPase YchF [Acidimicrobiales bacterium]|jgi:GTP-binding protein YchF|nr:redox-regulated ATPase YchF [Acidimicrobiales bacterium]HLV90894.1 redox-regulated ATPase YchF [Acidimicrobiia bacterium]
MSLAIGIVGLPNVGKSTLFNALTAAGAVAANYPFATIDPNVGVVPIPDPRLEVLAGMFGSEKITPATVTFVDIAGLVRGASKGEGLGNRFLANIRDVDAICHVVRAFQAPDVTHVEEDVDPARDIAVIETELALADLETIERRLPRLEKEATVDRKLAPQVELMRRLHATVSEGKRVSADPVLWERRAEFADLHLLTAKPVIFVFNSDPALLADDGRKKELADLVAPSEALFIDAEFEAELAGLDPADRDELLEAAGLEEPGLNHVIRAAYRTLGLQSFLTAGPKETRAWTIRSGATAPEAAGVIHTDFQRGFIAAEVVSYERLVEAGSWQAARSAGLIRSEGKSYVMRPDDVVEFRFNV